MNWVSFLRSVSIFLATLALAWSQTVPNTDSGANSANSKDAPVSSDQTLKQVPGPRSQQPDPLLDLPRLKQDRASLIGGTVEHIDRLRDRFTLRPFGRGKLTIVFDPRTQFVRGENPASAEDM